MKESSGIELETYERIVPPKKDIRGSRWFRYIPISAAIFLIYLLETLDQRLIGVLIFFIGYYVAGLKFGGWKNKKGKKSNGTSRKNI